MDKIPLIVGNWKMELSHKASLEVFQSIQKIMDTSLQKAEVVICPSFPSLDAIHRLAKESNIAIGAQNIHHEEKGAFTGGVSINQVREFISWCILGHSEVRAMYGDSDVKIMQKTKILLSHGIRPIVCIGETKQQYDDGETITVISAQLDVLLSMLDRVSLMRTVIAYEPIWAIGSGQLPDVNNVYEVLLLIRKRVAERFDGELAERMCLLYGGSVKGDNVAPYISGPGADGVLVGGASIHPRDFTEIISHVAAAYAS